MAVVKLQFWVDLVTGAFYSSDAAATAFVFRTLIAGDGCFLSVGFVTPDASGGPGALVKIQNAGLTVRVGLGTQPTVLTSVNLAANGIYLMEGVLPLNVAAVTGLFNAGNETKTFSEVIEVEVTDGGNISSFQSVVSLKNELLASTVVAPAPPERSMGVNEANNSFVKLRGTKSFIMTDSVDGTEQLITLVNGVLQCSPLT